MTLCVCMRPRECVCQINWENDGIKFSFSGMLYPLKEKKIDLTIRSLFICFSMQQEFFLCGIYHEIWAAIPFVLNNGEKITCVKNF